MAIAFMRGKNRQPLSVTDKIGRVQVTLYRVWPINGGDCKNWCEEGGLENPQDENGVDAEAMDVIDISKLKSIDE